MTLNVHPTQTPLNSTDKKKLKRLSLRLRVSIFFIIALIITWLIAAFIIWKESKENIDEFFDTQQLLFAKRLSASELSELIGTPQTNSQLGHVDIQKKYAGEVEDEALGFSIFSLYGHELLHDGMRDDKFLFRPDFYGFENAPIGGSDHLWRIIWMPSEDGRFVVAVGQELNYRYDMVLDMMKEQLLPWLILLPILLMGQIWILSKELRPMRKLGDSLQTRDPKNNAPLPLQNIPLEMQPFVSSLNQLFERTGQMIHREQAFIAAAAHELKTPLAGIQVQAEVARMCSDDPQALQAALDKLLAGIHRTTHLTQQLLTLSRIDAIEQDQQQSLGDIELKELDWQALLSEALSMYKMEAQRKKITISCDMPALTKMPLGDPTLILILLRNLISNAVAYTPDQGVVNVTLSTDVLYIENSCAVIPKDIIGDLGDRFYRMAGQTQPGSGLGLPIVRRIAEIHHFNMEWGQKNNADNEKVAFFFVQIQLKEVLHV